MYTRKESIRIGGTILLGMGIVSYPLFAPSATNTFSIEDVSKDSTITFTKDYYSDHGTLSIKGQLDRSAAVDVSVLANGEKTGTQYPLYKVGLPSGAVSESLTFDIYSETTVKIRFHHQRATHGFLRIDTVIPEDLFSTIILNKHEKSR